MRKAVSRWLRISMKTQMILLASFSIGVSLAFAMVKGAPEMSLTDEASLPKLPPLIMPSNQNARQQADTGTIAQEDIVFFTAGAIPSSPVSESDEAKPLPRNLHIHRLENNAARRRTVRLYQPLLTPPHRHRRR